MAAHRSAGPAPNSRPTFADVITGSGISASLFMLGKSRLPDSTRHATAGGGQQPCKRQTQARREPVSVADEGPRCVWVVQARVLVKVVKVVQAAAARPAWLTFSTVTQPASFPRAAWACELVDWLALLLSAPAPIAPTFCQTSKHWGAKPGNDTLPLRTSL
ncbi:hypothetical protein AOQ84DRAFT_223289 [Glonium stellatum]|uniref:Uncharacterized protein n=1 Tax=Glonium stellatum TaxID=574774 RepID=A0A8E2FCD6_9PEZI|nr:hypothetical protein AOQ84DRAFT_223289 [Glonium stellatum]